MAQTSLKKIALEEHFISSEDEKIFHRNAGRLLKLS